jgi:hypothetical protein
MNAVRRSRLSGVAVALTALAAVACVSAAPAEAAGGNATPGPLARDAATTKVWYHPGANQTLASDIWIFNNSNSTGLKKSVLPTATAWPVQTQYPFTYTAGGTTVMLAWTVSGSRGRIITLGYTAATDVMVVNVDGRQQSWFGCKAANLPQIAVDGCQTF